VLLNGRAGPTVSPRGTLIEDDLLLIILNSHHEIVEFTLPQLPIEGSWTRVLDTADPDGEGKSFPNGTVLPMPGRSLAVLSMPVGETAAE
jgi:glycogen operon protein